MSLDPKRSTRVRRALLVVALLAPALASALALGWAGYRVELGAVRISVREPRNPLVLALAAAIVAWSLAPAGSRGRTLIADCLGPARALVRVLARQLRADAGAWLRAAERVGPAVGAAAAIAAVVVGMTLGAPVAGGSDSYGYVSQAHLWATGRMREELDLVRELVPAVRAEALVPLGYNLAADRESMVPVYAPGLPMVMAVFERLAGRAAVFWVVPLLGGVAVWSTYLLARRTAGRFAGALAAVLLAASPAFLLQLTAAPMSEVPATAWWALALALLCSQRAWARTSPAPPPSPASVHAWARTSPAPSPSPASVLAWASPAAGFAAGLAILTRPNLVPLALVPGVLLWRRARSSASDRRRLLLFAAPVVAACLAVAAINDRLYGSPLQSGYDVRALYGLEHALPNLARYPALLSAMQTPLIWLAAAAPWLAWRRRDRAARVGPETGGRISGARARAASASEADTSVPRAATLLQAAFVLAVFACYLCYPAFDAFYTLRFLVPALPALFGLLAFTLVAAVSASPSRWRALAALCVTAIVIARGLSFARESSAFDTRGDRKYAIVGEYVARRLPERAVLLAMQHSGSVRYYSGRDIVRYDVVAPQRLDRVVKRLERLGYHPYFLLEDWEAPVFRERFAARSPLGMLDWPPRMKLEHANVLLWDPEDRERRRDGQEPPTEIVPWPYPLP